MELKQSVLPETSLLKNIFSPPAALYYLGDFSLLSSPCFSIVGSRYPEPRCAQASLKFSKQLSRTGFTIVSGLARGVDAFAHQGALLGGKTIAVMGCGLDRIYPPEHRRLANQIVEKGGLLLSEFSPGIPPLKHHFPKRNRLIAGLSKGILIIQAGEKSGSLITAQFAADESRDVFVLPGNWEDPRFAGSHRLIQDGAFLAAHPEDIEHFYGIRSTLRPLGNLEGLFEDGINDLGELWERSSWTISQLAESLAQAMERQEIVEVAPQKYVWVGT